MPPLLNYTTSVDALKTVNEIQRKLVAHGASEIIVGYGPDRVPDALAFRVRTAEGSQFFNLPANVKAIEATLALQAKRGVIRKSFATREQAARVAWRIIKDWIEAQIAIIESGMVTIQEVFFPYLSLGGQTAYQAYQCNQLQLAPPD
jgi:hypothetical protein